MSTMLDSPTLDPAQDPAINRRTRAFLKELNENSSPFWELPGDEPRTIVTALQHQTPVDLSGIEVDQHQLTVDGRTIALHIVRPTGATGTLPVFMFYHGAVLDRWQLRESQTARARPRRRLTSRGRLSGIHARSRRQVTPSRSIRPTPPHCG